MMPVVKSFEATMKLIFIYSMALVAVSLVYIPVAGGWIYAVAAFTLGFVHLYKIQRARREQRQDSMLNLFLFSIFHLFGLFAAMTLDKIVSL
jgi:protoheme IX farnesyltransferase